MFIDLSKTVFFFLILFNSSSPCILSFNQCLFSYNLRNLCTCIDCSAHQVQTWHSWVFGYEGKDLGYVTNASVLGCSALKKTKKTLLTLKVVMLCTGCVLIERFA